MSIDTYSSSLSVPNGANGKTKTFGLVGRTAMGYDTRIPIDSETRDRLRGEKIGNETYTETIDRLLGVKSEGEIKEQLERVESLQENDNDEAYQATLNGQAIALKWVLDA